MKLRISEAGPSAAATSRYGTQAGQADPADAEQPGLAPGAAWRLRMLGAFELSNGRQRVGRLSSRAALVLLARLAMHPGTAVGRETLVDALWPEATLEAGRHRLRQTLSTLRHLLEPPDDPGFEAFEADRNSIRLRPGVLQCDVRDFEQAIAEGRTADARALYAGELLPGVAEEWVEDERRRLADLAEALPASSGAATTPPVPVRPVPARASASHWPNYVSPWLGDEALVKALQSEILSHRLVTAHGPGGVGKTRLAVASASALQVGGDGHDLAAADSGDSADTQQACFGVACFVPLAACRDAHAMLDQIEFSLQLGAARGSSLETISTALSGRRVLLVLDNLEQLESAASDVIAQLLQRLPSLHVLATSRRPLGVEGERLLAVSGLALPAADSPLEQAASNPAVMLFLDRARSARADFHLHRDNFAGVVDIVRLLDGLPLGIELAAARVRTLPPIRMAQLLRESLSRGSGMLALLARPGPEGDTARRHGSMQAAIAWSWSLLPEGRRGQLLALTIPASPFPSAAVAALFGCDDAAAAALIDEFVQQSWVRAEPGVDEEAMFVMAEPVREFCSALLPADQAAVHRRRHRAGWLARTSVLPPDPPLAPWQAAWADIARAMQTAPDDGDAGQALELALNLRWVIEHLRLPPPAFRALRLALDRCDAPALVAEVHAMVAPLAALAGTVADGLAHVEGALSWSPPERPDIRAEALINKARLHWTVVQDDPHIEQALDQAWALLDATADPRAQELRARWCSIRGLAMSSRAAMHKVPGSRQEALRLHRQALSLWQATGHTHMVARIGFDLGIAAYYDHRFDEAIERMQPVLSHARQERLLSRQSQAWQVIGDSLSHLRRWAEALAALHQSIRAAWAAHAPLELGFGFWCLPRPLVRLGCTEDAVRLAGFIEAYWIQRCGALNRPLERLLIGAQRLAATQRSALQVELLMAEGRVMSVDTAVSRVAGLARQAGQQLAR